MYARRRVHGFTCASIWICIAAGCAALGCDDDDENVETRPGVDEGASGSGGTDGGFGDGENGDGSDRALTDDQIAGAVIVANAGEITLGQLALSSASDVRTVAFAVRLVSEHTQANRDLGRLIETSSLELETSPMAERFAEQSEDTLEILRAASSEDFDLEFAIAQRMAHVRLVSIVDSTLLPAVASPALETQLVALRTAAVAHLQEASVLIAELRGEAP